MAKDQNQQKRSARKRNASIAIIAWFILAFMIFVFFMIERKVIVNNLQDFFGKVFYTKTGDESSLGQVIPPQLEVTTPGNETSPITIAQSQAQSIGGMPQNANEIGESQNAQQNPPENIAAQNNLADVSENLAHNQGEGSQNIPQTAQAELCFVVIDGDGSVSRKLVIRDLPRSSAPLTAAINALLAGPTPAEQSASCTTLIPESTRLLGASVRDSVAYLNFSDDFEINTVGVEGYTAQMMQIVYTATSFPTVNSVQFLIGGELKDYLGSEGLWIGSPLNRASFR